MSSNITISQEVSDKLLKFFSKNMRLNGIEFHRKLTIDDVDVSLLVTIMTEYLTVLESDLDCNIYTYDEDVLSCVKDQDLFKYEED